MAEHYVLALRFGIHPVVEGDGPTIIPIQGPIVDYIVVYLFFPVFNGCHIHTDDFMHNFKYFSEFHFFFLPNTNLTYGRDFNSKTQIQY